MPDFDVQVNVNDRTHDLAVPSHRSLLDVLRDELDLTGAQAEVRPGRVRGARTVLLDGKPVCSCIKLVGQIRDCQEASSPVLLRL